MKVSVGQNKERSESIPATFSMKAAAASAKPYQPNHESVPPKQEENPERSLKFGFGFHHATTSWCPLNDGGLPLRSVCVFASYFDEILISSCLSIFQTTSSDILVLPGC